MGSAIFLSNFLWTVVHGVHDNRIPELQVCLSPACELWPQWLLHPGCLLLLPGPQPSLHPPQHTHCQLFHLWWRNQNSNSGADGATYQGHHHRKGGRVHSEVVKWRNSMIDFYHGLDHRPNIVYMWFFSNAWLVTFFFL